MKVFAVVSVFVVGLVALAQANVDPQVCYVGVNQFCEGGDPTKKCKKRNCEIIPNQNNKLRRSWQRNFPPIVIVLVLTLERLRGSFNYSSRGMNSYLFFYFSISPWQRDLQTADVDCRAITPQFGHSSKHLFDLANLQLEVI